MINNNYNNYRDYRKFAIHRFRKGLKIASLDKASKFPIATNSSMR